MPFRHNANSIEWADWTSSGVQIDQQAVVRGVMEDLQALAPFGQFEAAQAVVGQIPELEPGVGAGDGQALAVEKAQVPHRSVRIKCDLDHI